MRSRSVSSTLAMLGVSTRSRVRGVTLLPALIYIYIGLSDSIYRFLKSRLVVVSALATPGAITGPECI